MALARIPRIRFKTGFGRSKIYVDERAGLLPAWVRLGPKIVAMPEDELDVVLAARIANQSDDDVRALVCQMVERRADQLSKLTCAFGAAAPAVHSKGPDDGRA